MVRKAKDAQLLVKKVIEYLGKNELYDACHVFSNDPSWRKGDISPVIIHQDGTVILSDYRPQLTWQLINALNKDEARWFKQIKQRAAAGGGWTLRHINNDIRTVYVEQVTKNHETYYVGAGFFPAGQIFELRVLVETAVDYFKRRGAERLLKLFKTNALISGDMIVLLINQDGIVEGTTWPADIVGVNLHETKEPLFDVWRAIVEKAKTASGGTVEATLRGAPCRGYFKRVYDRDRVAECIIAGCTYLPLERDDVLKVGARAVRMVQEQRSAKQLVSLLKKKYAALQYGPVITRIFDAQGQLLFDARFPQQPPHNKKVAKEGQHMLRREQKRPRGWITKMSRNTLYVQYYERVQTQEGLFIVTLGCHTNSKELVSKTLVTYATRFLQKYSPEEAFAAFSKPNSVFSIGDASLVVYTLSGRCMVHLEQPEYVWYNVSNIADQNGTLIIPEMQLLVKREGEGWGDFALNNSTKHVYVKRVKAPPVAQEAEDSERLISYMIAAGYYR